MYIVIIGAGGIGKRLTEISLRDGKHNVIVIDKDQSKCEEIARKYDAIAINADATQEETLDESEVKKADVLVTTTNDDANNFPKSKARSTPNGIVVVATTPMTS